MSIHVGPLRTSNDTAGTIVAVTQSSVASQVAGVAAAVLRQPGDWVKAGATVVQLDDSQLKLAVQTAAVQPLDRPDQLRDRPGQHHQSAPKLALQVQSAQSAVDSAQKFYNSQKALADIGRRSASAVDNANSSSSRRRPTSRRHRPPWTRTRSPTRSPSPS